MSFCKSYFLLAFFIGLTCITSDSLAQSQAQSQEIINRFNQAANEHRFFMTDLYNSRAVVENPYSHPLSSQDISAEGIASTLALTSEAGYCCLPELGVTYQEKTAVLFYAYNQEVLQIWLIDQSGILAYHRYDINEERIVELVDQFRETLEIYPQQSLRIPLPRSLAIVYEGNVRTISFEQASLELTELLLPEPITRGLEGVHHLLVVPILNIGTIPYGALQPFQDDSFLIDRMSISIAPSLYDLGIKVHPWDATSTFSSSLIVGDPLLPSSDSWNLPPLPGAQQEARVVAQLVGTEPLIAEAATKEAVLARAFSSVPYLEN